MSGISPTARGFALATISAVCWGTNGAFLKALQAAGINDATLVALAPAILGLFFLVRLLVLDRAALRVPWKLAAIMLLQGLVVIDGSNYAYVRAVATVPIGIVSVLAFCNVLVLVVLVRIVFGHRIARHTYAAIAAALAGLCLVLQVFSLDGGLSFTGMGWALLIPLFFASGYTLDKYYLTRGVKEEAILCTINLWAALPLWAWTPPWAVAADIGAAARSAGPAVWLALFGFAVVPQIAAWWLYFRAFRYVSPATVAFCYALDPVTATVLGLAFFSQAIGPDQLAGMAVVIAAILFDRSRSQQALARSTVQRAA